MQFFLPFYPLALAFLAKETFGEIFTSLVDMEELLKTEDVLLDGLEDYIKITEDKLTKLRTYLEEFKLEHSQAKKGIQDYVSNPINAYLITKRLTSDWFEMEAIMNDDMGKRFLDELDEIRSKSELSFPTNDDLNGAAVAIARLQRTYNLTTTAIANGDLNGVNCGRRLSAGDCFEMGKQNYINSDYHYTDLWMREALYRYHEEVNKTGNLVDIIEHIAYSTYMKGKIREALNITKKLLEMDPEHERALENKQFYEDRIRKLKDEEKEEEGEVEDKYYDFGDDYFSDLSYAKLCRKDLTLSEKVKAKLKCKYVDFGRPFLKLARLKEEEANLEPRIVLYHDVIYDREIKAIKELAIPRFQRATVQNPRTGLRETATYRISKVAWLNDEFHPRVADLSRRIIDITGLSLESSESLQVVNYGIGGHYEVHCDYSREGEKRSSNFEKQGNRIATILFYMSDVPQGGATVFPALNVSLWPKKGTAVLWYNLFKDGRGDFRTQHGACPVLTGSKWVCTKWLHEVGQEFLRPCGLTEDFIDTESENY